MTAYEFMRNSAQVLVGVLCWAGVAIIGFATIAIMVIIVEAVTKPQKKKEVKQP